MPRGEVQQVDSLRDEWRKLTDLAEKVTLTRKSTVSPLMHATYTYFRISLSFPPFFLLITQIQYQLLSEQRLYFEREVDKQVKAFVVETIQFRNSFDTEGPLVPGLMPSEAVARLGQLALFACNDLHTGHVPLPP